MFSCRNQPLFGVRIISVEYGIESVAKDTFVSPLTSKPLAWLPVVYIFGPNSNNESCSITVKECFPYFYIDWPGSLNDLFDEDYIKKKNGLSWDIHPYTLQGIPRFQQNTTTNMNINYYPPFKKISDFLIALSYVLNSAFKEFAESGIVYTIDVVLRRSIYGFHRQRRPFFKVYLLETKFVHMAAQLLFRGEFYGIKFQPYNVHLLGHQFLVDHNLFGMDVLWAYKKDLKISSNARLTCKYNYTLKAGKILNSYMNAQKLKPDVLQDKESLVDIIKGSHYAYLCDSQFKFTTMLKTNKEEYCWKDPWISDVYNEEECILTTSLQEFWKDEVKRRRSLKQATPESLKVLRSKETSRLITSIHQMVKEKYRPLLESLCPSFSYSNYTFHEKLDVHFEDIHHSKDQITLPQEPKFKIHYSNPFDMPQKWFLKKLKKKQLSCRQSKINFSFCQALTKGNKFFIYELPPPSIEQVCNTVLTFSRETNDENSVYSDLTSGVVTLGLSTLIEDQLVESLESVSSNDRLFDTSSETISDTLSLDNNKEKLSNQFYKKNRKPLIQTCGTRIKKKISPTPLLDLLQKRYRERFKSTKNFFHGPKEKKQSIRLPSNIVIPQYHTILGLNIITNTVFNSKNDEAFHFVPNPRVDKLLGVVYMLRCESWNHEKTIASTSYLNTFDTRFGVAQVVDTLPFSESWDTFVIPISHEVYQAKYISGTNFFLNKKEIALDTKVEQFYVPTECDLIFWILHNLFREFDPSFVLGFDIQTEALGFIFRRAVLLGFYKPHLHFQRLIPHFPLQIISYKKLHDKTNEINLNNYMKFYSKEIKLMGRVILNLWKLLKQYEKSVYDTLGGLVQKCLHITYPLYSLDTITEWWNAKHCQISFFPLRNLAIHYKLCYLKLCFKLFDTSDLFNRFSERSRFLGTDITSTIHRGSQYHVEGLIARAGTFLGYVMPTAAKIQVANQPAIMSIPLVLEPESKFYEDPVVVLDFQSLYPSIIIAYNICFSTCLGHISCYTLNNKSKEISFYEEEKCIPLGILSDTCVTSLNEVVSNQKDKVTIFPAPNGVLYVVSNVRRGILPSLLEQVISTRLAIKKSIQLIDNFLISTSNTLCKSTSLPSSHKYANMFVRAILDARQAALKNFANFTYGYTSASYSGRMPCSDVADSIVHIAKDTLKRAIVTIESHPKWDARVVYGDTDSLFVLLKNRSLSEAFILGQEMIRRVTSLNPWPVELRMEKVYMPCILQTKKRYVGWKYVSETQPPVLESKGIETIRRDQCGVMVKCLTNVFEILFKTYNISKVKEFLLNYWMKMYSFEPHVSLIDFIFYRKLKLTSYSYFRTKKLHTLPPQAFVACRLFQRSGYGSQDDPEWFYEYGKRVPYVVVKSTESSRLCDMVTSAFDVTIAGHQPFSPLSPVCFLALPRYLEKIKKFKRSPHKRRLMIPTLDRFFSLIEDGVSVKDWFSQMPRGLYQKELQRANIISKRKEKMEHSYSRTFFKADYPNFNEARKLASFKNSLPPNGSSSRELLERNKTISNFSTLQLPTFIKGFSFCQQKIDNLIQAKKIRLVCELCGGAHYFEETTSFSKHSSEQNMINFFCPSCCRSPDSRILKLYAAWNRAEERFSKYMQICINCSGSRFAAEACQNALYCRVYTARNVERQRLYQSILDIEDCLK